MINASSVPLRKRSNQIEKDTERPDYAKILLWAAWACILIGICGFVVGVWPEIESEEVSAVAKAFFSGDLS